jgi:hypothetical protein
MFLYFLRHASAGQQLSTAKKDEKRGLDKDGIEQCGYIGRALAALGVQVEIIVSSPLKAIHANRGFGGQRNGARRQTGDGKRAPSAGQLPGFSKNAGKVRAPGFDPAGGA